MKDASWSFAIPQCSPCTTPEQWYHRQPKISITTVAFRSQVKPRYFHMYEVSKVGLGGVTSKMAGPFTIIESMSEVVTFMVVMNT